MNYKILQLLPADGWVARYREGGSDIVTDRSILAWALVEFFMNDGSKTQQVLGIDAADAFRFCESHPFFDCYVPPFNSSISLKTGILHTLPPEVAIGKRR